MLLVRLIAWKELSIEVILQCTPPRTRQVQPPFIGASGRKHINGHK